MKPRDRTSTEGSDRDEGGANVPRVLLLILNGSLAIVVLWALTLLVTARDPRGLVLILALLVVPIVNGGVLLTVRFLARRRL